MTFPQRVHHTCLTPCLMRATGGGRSPPYTPGVWHARTHLGVRLPTWDGGATLVAKREKDNDVSQGGLARTGGVRAGWLGYWHCVPHRSQGRAL